MTILTLAASLFTQIIPLVTPGSVVRVQNDEPNDQMVIVSFTAERRQFAVPAHGTLRIAAPGAGFVLIESDKTDVHAWSEVQGVAFPATHLNTNSRTFTADATTGLAIANPWDEPVRMTLWLYDGKTGAMVMYKNFVLPAGSTTLRMLEDMVGKTDAPNGFLVNALTERPVAIGAASCHERCVSLPVSAMGIMEVTR